MSRKINFLNTYFFTSKLINYLNNLTIYEIEIKIPYKIEDEHKIRNMHSFIYILATFSRAPICTRHGSYKTGNVFAWMVLTV